jgi:glycosyltransferase involved in cell wall biosynthesis
VIQAHNIESYVAFGYGYNISDKGKEYVYRIETDMQLFISKVWTKLTGHHGFNNKRETKKLLNWIDKVTPDLIHMHNIHNHYVNIQMLLQYISEKHIPCVLTMHDCWTFTGHCAYFDFSGCEKWRTGCHNCPSLRDYPKTFAPIDPSPWNYKHKKSIFAPLNITFVSPSNWLCRLQQQSFLKDKPCEVINNGIDLSIFHPIANKCREYYDIGKKKMILAVTDRLLVRKGRKFLLDIPKLLNDEEVLVLVGVTGQQQKELTGIDHLITITRTKSSEELVGLYSAADVFINPTLEDNFPTTNLEALACGTPVVTFDTGGSGEAVDEYTGKVVTKGNLKELVDAMREILAKGKGYYRNNCLGRAKKYYNKDTQYMKYIDLYKQLLNE